MLLYNNILYIDDIKNTCTIDLPWNKLKNNSILVSGATGMIGSFLIDVIMYKNMFENLHCTVYALGRSLEKAQKRFLKFYGNKFFNFIQYDVNTPFTDNRIKDIGYVIHLASNTHPMQYATDPIGTITANIFGVKNMLDFCSLFPNSRFVFASSNEIYGENRGDVELFDENYCGYINSNTLRAGYPESKRCGEALCQAYKSQRNVDFVIARLTRSYGPTLLPSDTKALSQFLHNALSGNDIVLKSKGTQFYSYTYTADAVSGLLTLMLRGVSGEAYNISNPASDIMLKDLAQLIAKYCNKKVIFELPSATEKSGYSTATKARLESSKLRQLGWIPQYTMDDGIKRTIEILKDLSSD